MIRKFKHPDAVIDQIKRSKIEIDSAEFTTCMVAANLAIERSTDGTDLGNDDVHDLIFAEKSFFLYSSFVNKLNTDLHSKTVGATGKNGFELYRQFLRIGRRGPWQCEVSHGC